MSQAMRLYKAS